MPTNSILFVTRPSGTPVLGAEPASLHWRARQLHQRAPMLDQRTFSLAGNGAAQFSLLHLVQQKLVPKSPAAVPGLCCGARPTASPTWNCRLAPGPRHWKRANAQCVDLVIDCAVAFTTRER